mgnify:CR=1 FL=1
MIRWIYLKLRGFIMARSGLQPWGGKAWSRTGAVFKDDPSLGLALPNLTGFLVPVLRQFMDMHGLGKECLLVSESNAVRERLQPLYPDTRFTTCDKFPRLIGPDQDTSVDVEWDVCMSTTVWAGRRFNSVIAQALVEHVIDPTRAIRNMASLLKEDGFLYLMTCTPSFHYHAYPRDYVRFHQDYFEDLPEALRQTDGLQIRLEELFLKGGIICACYQRLG